MTPLNPLFGQLNHPDPNVRSNAALSLGDMGEQGGLALIEALTVEQELMVREDITWALVRIGDATVQPLIDLLKHPDAQVRHHAAHVLGKLRTPVAVQPLCVALHDENAIVVQKVAFSLGQIGDTRAIPALVSILGHLNPTVRTTLLDVLEGFGEMSLPFLQEAVQHRVWQTREQAVDVLGQIGGNVVWPMLSAALGDDHWEVRFAAVTALEQSGNQAILASLVNDPDSRVSNLVLEILSRSTTMHKRKLPSL